MCDHLEKNKVRWIFEYHYRHSQAAICFPVHCNCHAVRDDEGMITVSLRIVSQWLHWLAVEMCAPFVC